MPDKSLRYFLLTIILAGAILAFLLQVNSHYLFHALLYENGDPGANSLSVLRAGHLHEIYGNYSRWGFHHPGPAVLYSFALGEGIFYRMFHLVPTPYNAQVIMLMILVSSFFAAGVCVAARWVRGVVFVPLAVLAAAFHFTAMDPLTWALLAWMPFVMTLLFFAMLIAAASVGAGQGDDLPLLALSCGFMLHTHVAQPLFVGPIFLLAYAGLWWTARRGAARTQPWRAYPRAHVFAAMLLAAFALPMLVDLLFGSRSNLALILDHVRTYHGQHHPWLDALYCFLRFGGYDASHNFNAPSPDNVTRAEIGRFVLRHLKMELIWLGALLAPLVAYVLYRRDNRLVLPAGAAEAPPAEPARPDPGWRWRFIGSLTFFWFVTAALTVFWNHIQDGDMYYYNSWFTYSVYYVLALLGVAGVSDLVERWAARRTNPGVITGLAAALCLLAAGSWISLHLRQYRAVPFDDETSRAQARTVDAVLAARSALPRTKLLVFPHDAWGAATGITDLLIRKGYPCVVPPEWRFMFGADLAPDDLFSRRMAVANGDAALDIWHLVPASAAGPALTARYPLIDGYVLMPGGGEINPAKGTAITFVGQNPSSDLYVLTGWTSPGPGAEYTFSQGTQGFLNFSPVPVPSNAAVAVDFYLPFPRLVPGKRDAQRLALSFNGHDLGTLRVDEKSPKPLTVTIPAAIWNEHAAALFALGFPDAISPLEAGESTDYRQLAFATERITFRVVEAGGP